MDYLLLHCLYVLEQLVGKACVFDFVQCFGHEVCSVAVCADATQVDDACVAVLSYHMVSEIKTFRPLVGRQITVHKHSPFVGHVFMHGEVDL